MNLSTKGALRKVALQNRLWLAVVYAGITGGLVMAYHYNLDSIQVINAASIDKASAEDVLLTVSKLRSTVSLAEARKAEYIITSNNLYRQQYLIAITTMPILLQHIRLTNPESPVIIKEVEQLDKDVRYRQQIFDQIILAFDKHGESAAANLINQEIGLKATVKINQDLDAIEKSVERKLKTAQNRSRLAQSYVESVSKLVFVFSIFAGLLSIALSYPHQLRRSESV